MRTIALFLLVSLILSACTPAGSTAASTPTTPAPAAAASPTTPPDRLPVSARPAPTETAVSTPTFDPDSWTDLPVIPGLSRRAREILADGLARGNNPRAFSKIGDCESQASWFLENFDLGPEHYSLGEYQEELEPVIEYYAGSFKRVSLAARQGFTAASLMAPIWADPKQCEKDETPLACEYRLHRPLVAFIMVGTNDAVNPDTFEGHMRRVLDYTIEQGILPVLGTKADNIEGDHQINATIARLAYEYDIPLWNYWAAVQPLPGHGLQEDGAHLTYAGPFFDNPDNMRRAWPVRNLNALQVLSVVMAATEP